MTNSNSSGLKVRQPLFFKITYNNKVAYLLGTYHLFSAAVLPDDLHKIKDTCSAFVAESTYATLEELAEFQNDFLKLYGRRPEDHDWFAELTPVQQQLTQNLFDEFLDKYYDDFAPQVAVQNVRLSIVIDFVDFVLLPSISELFDAVLQDETAADADAAVVSGQMDLELASSFADEFALEDHFLWTRLVAEDMGKLEDLIEILDFAISLEDEAEEFEIPAEDVAQLIEIWERYRDGLHLTDFEYVFELDASDANKENNKMQKRNVVMFNNMLRLISENPGALFITAGAGHLIGAHGLLMHLDANNIQVALYDPNHNGVEMFQPYKYSMHCFAAKEKAAPGLYFRAVTTATDIVATASNDAQPEMERLVYKN